MPLSSLRCARRFDPPLYTDEIAPPPPPIFSMTAPLKRYAASL
ncbi:hypothetical protein Gbem_4109 [Citrifermentans bemidjiense Bem]|uniref:Uncharacterized protein n=1 Tax=Citrifermentans bemidjiense (strain ATCC BAA-1014 / DSM 16622 / JCM 12645 / Bem) TaxID=404380 RepID=E1P6B2_CITBB|nr:hypothetical protein Gbem_4109 [Citrifermentans bemidjiense Bem]